MLLRTQTEGKNGGGLGTRLECDNGASLIPILFWRYSMKAHSAQFIDILFQLVMSTLQGTHAVVAPFFIPARYSTNYHKIHPPPPPTPHPPPHPPTQCNNYTTGQFTSNNKRLTQESYGELEWLVTGKHSIEYAVSVGTVVMWRWVGEIESAMFSLHIQRRYSEMKILIPSR